MAEGHAIMNVCMAASYDPDLKAPNGFRLPFNLETGELLKERWKRWQANDPVNLVAKHRKNLATLRGASTSTGVARPVPHPVRLAHPLEAPAAGGDRPHLRGIQDNHSDIDYRMDVSLPFLTKALK